MCLDEQGWTSSMGQIVAVTGGSMTVVPEGGGGLLVVLVAILSISRLARSVKVNWSVSSLNGR